MIINEKAKRPIDACMRVLKTKVKESGKSPNDYAAELGVGPAVFKGWFKDGSMPYSAFLSLIVSLGTKATTVFEEAKAVIKADREAERAAALAAAGQQTASTENVDAEQADGDEAPSMSNVPADAIDDGGDVEEDENEVYEEEDESSTAEAAPGVPLTDKSSPEALPYDLGDFALAKTDSSMTDADLTLMEWPSIVSDALDAHSDSRPMTPERKAKLSKKYPKPAKTDNPAELSITFGSYESAQRFANDGYLNDLQAVISKRHRNITLLPLPEKAA